MEIMTILPAIIESAALGKNEDFATPTYRQTLELKEEVIWRNLAGISLSSAEWLSTLSPW